jgi:hypothetical protein
VLIGKLLLSVAVTTDSLKEAPARYKVKLLNNELGHLCIQQISVPDKTSNQVVYLTSKTLGNSFGYLL